MIKTKIYIDKYDWCVDAYIAVTHYNVDEILSNLRHLGCDGEDLYQAEVKLRENALNSGLTYSSYVGRETIMVTALADSAKEQYNTISHEVCHVCSHIATANYIDRRSEAFAYLVGDLSMALYPKIKNLICDCCRTKIVKHERYT